MVRSARMRISPLSSSTKMEPQYSHSQARSMSSGTRSDIADSGRSITSHPKPNTGIISSSEETHSSRSMSGVSNEPTILHSMLWIRPMTSSLRLSESTGKRNISSGICVVVWATSRSSTPIIAISTCPPSIRQMWM